MFINPVDDKNIVSFIHGYEAGAKNKCDFTQLSRQLLTDKYKISYSNDGWPGQITRLSKKKSWSWVVTFKNIALEVVADKRHGGLDKKLTEILKSKIISLIERIQPLGDICFNDSWAEAWLSLCPVKDAWFKHLWGNDEWLIIKSITKQVQADKIFSEKDKQIPTEKLLKLKYQYDRTTKENGT